MMFIFISSKRWVNTVSFCGLLALSLPSGATVVTSLSPPPPKTKLVTTATKVGGKWVTTIDPIGVESFSLDVEFDPSQVWPDSMTGANGVDILAPYLPSTGSSPYIEFTSPTAPAFIRNISGYLPTGQSPVADIFKITFTDTALSPSAFQFRAFANKNVGTTSFMNISDGVTTPTVVPLANIEDGICTVAINATDCVPVPEPNTAILFTMGLVGMSAYRITHHKKQTA